MNRNYADSAFILSALSNINFTLVPSPPTHHSQQTDRYSHTWIDLILTSCHHCIHYFRKTSTPFAAGHDWVEITLSYPSPVQRRDYRRVRRLNLVNAGNVATAFAGLTDTFDPDLTVDDLANCIGSAITTVFDNVAPLSLVRVGVRRRPWVTPEVRQLIMRRDAVYRRYGRMRCPRDLLLYRRLRSEIRNLLDSLRARFLVESILSTADPRSLWRSLGRMGFASAPLPHPVQFFSLNDLNLHYSSISSSSTPLNATIIQSIIDDPELIPPVPFDLKPFEPSSVALSLRLLNSTSKGVDGISGGMISLLVVSLIAPLTNLLNLSITEGIFPSHWKRALITPLSKNKTPLSPSDTRPIALLPELSKAFERLVLEQLTRHLEATNFMNPRQSGFRRGHSTQTALLGLTGCVREGVERRELTILVLFDFSKAFDTLDHSILLRKLRSLGCGESLLRWFVSYLAGRTQSVVGPDGERSTWLPLNSGVPQGSVLGPTLFSIYTADFKSVLQLAGHEMFADDLQIYLRVPFAHLELGIQRMNEEIQRVVDWAGQNLLRINPSKTKAVILGTRPFLSRLVISSLPPLIVNDCPLAYSNEVVSLGLRITPTLDWSPHISGIVQRVHRILYSIRLYRSSLTLQLRKHLVETLIFPLFDYCSVVYHPLPRGRELILHRLMNACVRAVFASIGWREHVTPYRLALGWLTPESRRHYNAVSLALSILSQNRPIHLAQLFVPSSSASSRSSVRNQRPHFTLPFARTEALNGAFHIYTARLLNTLLSSDGVPTPDEIAHLRARYREILYRAELDDWTERASSLGIDPTVPGLL